MAITVDKFMSTVGADASTDRVEAQTVLTQAILMVGNYVGTSVVPVEIVDLAVMKVAAVLWDQSHMRSTVNQSFYETDQSVAPGNRNPMAGAYQVLRGWVLPW